MSCHFSAGNSKYTSKVINYSNKIDYVKAMFSPESCDSLSCSPLRDDSDLQSRVFRFVSKSNVFNEDFSTNRLRESNDALESQIEKLEHILSNEPNTRNPLTPASSCQTSSLSPMKRMSESSEWQYSPSECIPHKVSHPGAPLLCQKEEVPSSCAKFMCSPYKSLYCSIVEPIVDDSGLVAVATTKVDVTAGSRLTLDQFDLSATEDDLVDQYFT